MMSYPVIVDDVNTRVRTGCLRCRSSVSIWRVSETGRCKPTRIKKRRRKKSRGQADCVVFPIQMRAKRYANGQVFVNLQRRISLFRFIVII